jgi:hypothetical protein
MPAEVIGTPQTLDVGQTAAPGAQSVTVPADAEYAAFFFGGWYDSGSAVLDSLTSNFAGTWTITQSSGATVTGVAVAEVTSTGSRTITPVWATVLSQGPAVILAFIRNVDSADPVRDTAALTDSGVMSLSVDSSASDLVLALESYAGSSAPDNQTGWTSLQTQVLTNGVSIGARLRSADSPGVATTTATTQATFFPRLAMVSFREGAAPSGVTGDLAAVESGADAAAVSGSVLISGAFAAQETGADTAAIVGGVLVSGALEATETGSDVAAVSGSVLVSGSLAAQEVGSDTFSSMPIVAGALAATESGADTFAASGTVTDRADTQGDVYNLFAERVALFAAEYSPALPVSYPGVPFTPPAAGIWLELRWFPNASLTRGISDASPAVTLVGIGQVSVCDRPGAGLAGGLSTADAVVAWFAKGTTLGVARVEVQPWVSAVLSEPDRTVYPVTVRWRGVNR